MGAAAEISAPQSQGNAGAASKSASPVGAVGLRVIKFFMALLLIPASVGFTLGAHDHFLNNWSQLNLAVSGPSMLFKWCAGGALMFGIVTVLLWRPVVLYVFGHEIVHALATWLCLGKVSNLVASARGGQVTTSKSNTFIRLAPYCVPLYALLAVGIFAGLNQWWQPLSAHLRILALVMGFFYAFHLGFTLWSLRRDQPDLKPDGWLFSLVLIYLGNLAVLVLLLGFLVQGQASGSWEALQDSTLAGWQHAGKMYQNLVSAAQNLAAR